MTDSDVHDSVTVLHFLDCLPDHGDLTRIDAPTRDFLVKAGPRIKSACSRLGVDVALHQDDSTKLVVSDREKIKKRLKERVYARGTFDYKELASRSVEASKAGILAHLDAGHGNFSRDTIATVSCAAVIPFEPSIGLETAERDFATGGNVIQHPDANLFHEGHFALWRQIQPVGQDEGRVFWDHFYRCLSTPCHELIHCIQTAAGWKVSSLGTWAYEFAACYGHFEVLKAACEADPARYPPGFLEEAFLYEFNIVKALHERVGALAVAGYEKWRDSFGAVEPFDTADSFQLLEDHLEMGYYVKLRLSLESFTGQRLPALLRHFFSPDYQRDGVVPDELRINASVGGIDVLSAPLGEKADLGHLISIWK